VLEERKECAETIHAQQQRRAFRHDGNLKQTKKKKKRIRKTDIIPSRHIINADIYIDVGTYIECSS